MMVLLEYDVPAGQHLPSGQYTVFGRNFNVSTVIVIDWKLMLGSPFRRKTDSFLWCLQILKFVSVSEMHLLISSFVLRVCFVACMLILICALQGMGGENRILIIRVYWTSVCVCYFSVKSPVELIRCVSLQARGSHLRRRIEVGETKSGICNLSIPHNPLELFARNACSTNVAPIASYILGGQSHTRPCPDDHLKNCACVTMNIHHVYKRPSFDNTANGFDEFTTGEWHYCGSWTQQSLVRLHANQNINIHIKGL